MKRQVANKVERSFHVFIVLFPTLIEYLKGGGGRRAYIGLAT